MKLRFVICTAAALILGLAPARADLSVTNQPAPGDFLLVQNATAVPVFVEAGEDRAVTRAVADLRADFARVTDVSPALATNPAAHAQVILIGTLGASKTLDQLAAAKKFDATGIAGRWESYVLQVVSNPLPGVDRALIIAGSDRRGTIYGIYQLSELIGVSPWYWWADVVAKKRTALALRGDRRLQPPPAVKYRGIFLNDEDWGLRPWAAKTFETNAANIGPQTYAKIFELLLRLRANYLWPAMHSGTRAFNHFPENKDAADAYGIVMGSSHCEQMLRNNVDEWQPAVNGEYNYVSNRAGVLNYWEQRVRENGRYENLYTVGMRGIHDSGMPGGGTLAEQAARLHRIIADQRELLARHVNSNVTAVPQIFVPYKEALELYRRAPDLPADITLVWPDDNFGYVRQFSDARERQRPGGAGVYYHISYLGRPANYLWLASTPPALIAEEMCKAYDLGADRVWVVNVGDLKPGEYLTEYFLRLAWNPHAWNGTNTYELLEKQFARDFTPFAAREMTAVLAEYYRLNFARKPEHILPEAKNTRVPFPVLAPMLNGDETETRLAAWREVCNRVDALQRKILNAHTEQFFELITYPVYGAATANEKAAAFTRLETFRQQRRAAAADLIPWINLADTALGNSAIFYNDYAVKGKWRHFFQAAPPVLPRDLPATNNLPALATNALLSLAVEGSLEAAHADHPPASPPHLPQFNRFTQRSYFVDVFNAGRAPLVWTAAASAKWLHLPATNGTGDARLLVSVDWTNAPLGEDVTGEIRFATTNGQALTVAVRMFNLPAAVAAGADFVEDNFRVVMEAEHPSAITPGADARWQRVVGLGYNGEAMTLLPATATARTTPEKIVAESPGLQYRFWTQHAGDWTVTVRALPTFSVVSGQPQRYAIAVDDAPPQVVALPVSLDEKNPTWQENVLRNAALTTSRHQLAQSGPHTLKVWMVDPGLVLDTIFIATTNAPALGYIGPAETKLVTAQP